MPAPPVAARQRYDQASFDELGTPLHEVTFVVVDLETTGGSPQSCEITEIGAVKVRGGEMLGEFQTLVNPGVPIPPFIAVLTGINNSMVAGAPRLGTALPAFLEFAGAESVLVAHNAPFDIGFLKAACAATGHEWPGNRVLDTARLARQVVTRDEAPNCKLASLARLFRARTTPNHRALSDARATVDVLHGHARAARQPRGALARRAVDVLLAGLPRAARASGTWPRRCPTCRASTSSSTSAARCCTSARARTCAPGSAPTSPPARPAAGWPRWWGSRPS